MVNSNGIGGDNAIVGENADATFICKTKGIAKCPVSYVIGAEFGYSLHLNNEKDSSTEALPLKLYKLLDMLHATLGGCVGKGCDTAILKSYALSQ